MRSLFRIARSATRLSRRDRQAALRALLWLLASRAAVRVAPYAAVARLVTRVRARAPHRDRLAPEQCARAIRRATRLLPGSGCLPQAIAAESFLRREGHDPRLFFGVALSATGQLDAHAWVENAGQPVVGGETAALYKPLSPPHLS